MFVHSRNHPIILARPTSIPAHDFWSEVLHGAAGNGRATVFPQAIGMAATWDPVLVQKIAAAVGDGARAKHRVTVGGCSPSERGVRLGASAPVRMAFPVTA